MKILFPSRRAGPGADDAALEGWDNEGGAPGVLGPARPTLQRRKRPEDTSEGCRGRAADDIDRAAALTGDRMRWRFEHSAAAWTARADMLARLEASFEARRLGLAAARVA